MTIRYGKRSQRYLTLTVVAGDVASALRLTADGIPEDLVSEVDLVELRQAPDFEKTFPTTENP